MFVKTNNFFQVCARSSIACRCCAAEIGIVCECKLFFMKLHFHVLPFHSCPKQLLASSRNDIFLRFSAPESTDYLQKSSCSFQCVLLKECFQNPTRPLIGLARYKTDLNETMFAQKQRRDLFLGAECEDVGQSW